MDRWEEKENRKFLRAGTIAAAALNPHIDHKRHPVPLTAYDFFNLPRPPAPKPTPAQLKAHAAAAFGEHNKRVARLQRRQKKSAGGAS